MKKNKGLKTAAKVVASTALSTAMLTPYLASAAPMGNINKNNNSGNQ